MTTTQAQNFLNGGDKKHEFQILFADWSTATARAGAVDELFRHHGADQEGKGNRLSGGYFQILEVRILGRVKGEARIWSASTETLERAWREANLQK